MSPRFSKLAAAMLGLVALMASLLIATPAQSASAGCRGGSCTGKDPKAQGCNRGAQTVRSFVNLSLYVELRYSPRCRAAWARWTVRRDSDMHHSDYVFIYRHNPNGTISKRRTTTGIEPGDQGWTAMIGRIPEARFEARNFIDSDRTKPLWPKQ